MSASRVVSGPSAPEGSAPPALAAADRRNGMPAGKALLAGLLGLAVAIVLNSQQLLREAQQKPFGWERDVSVAVWSPVEGAASAVGVHLPRLWGDEALGRDKPDPGDPSGGTAVIDASRSAQGADGTAGPGRTVVPEADSAADGAAGTGADGSADAPPGAGTDATGSTGRSEPSATMGSGGDAPVSSDAVDEPAPPTTTVPWFPTPADPLTLLIMGDSMVQFFGHVLVGLADDTGVIEAASEHQLSSGLSRPDFYDWPTRITEAMAVEDPDAVVLMFGGNDAQAVVVDGQIARRFSDAWVQEYSARVGHVMDLVTTDPERILIWVGQPIMEDAEYDSRMQRVNEVFASEAAKRDRVLYVDTRDLFRGPDGGFSRYVADADGQLADVRLSDGVHLSTVGGHWLSEVLLDELGRLVDLESGASS
ncbi:DUF459 domain-containing protein [Candidatus Poriferisodalis sp.]|uniref:SGNH/GDSL hydrolase family protein n=1 Tax=Candidatus Poriferisodalis sp. TaxID=3101277 RepID=UPI003B027911